MLRNLGPMKSPLSVSPTKSLAAIVFLIAAACIGLSDKRPLDHSVYDGWQRIAELGLSRDAQWLYFTVAPQVGDNVLHVQSFDGETKWTFDRASNISFSRDSRYLLATLAPPREAVAEARTARRPPAEQPRPELMVLELATGEEKRYERISNYSSGAEGARYLLLQPAEGKSFDGITEVMTPPAKSEVPEGEEAPPARRKSNHTAGQNRIVLDLHTGEQRRLRFVSASQWSRDGQKMLITRTTDHDLGHGLYLLDVESGEATAVFEGLAQYPRVEWHQESGMIAFFSNHEDYDSESPEINLYIAPQPGEVKKLIAFRDAMLPDGYELSSRATIQISNSGRRILLSTAPYEAEEEAEGEEEAEESEDEEEEEREINVDIWHWQDTRMMTQQLMQANADRNRTYRGVYHLDGDQYVQLETVDFRGVNVARGGDADYAIVTDILPYEIARSWGVYEHDIYLLDIRTGDREKLAEKSTVNISLSPTGKYFIQVYSAAGTVELVDFETRDVVSITDLINAPLFNVDYDQPGFGGTYGFGGWAADDSAVLIYDQYDPWLVTLEGTPRARNLTGGYGRRTETRFRVPASEREDGVLPLDSAWNATAFNLRSKDSGYVEIDPTRAGVPKRIIMEPKNFSRLSRNDDTGRLIYTREDFREPPDVWVAEENFENARKVSSINPQQEEYIWGSAQIVDYMSLDNLPLQGILFTPDDLEPLEQRPMIVYFYDRSSDGLHNYRAPAPSASTVNISYFVSNGYVVFVPDIYYRIGYPGESAVACVLPGVHAVLRRGIVDPARIGVQGQSWGGYQTAYLVTETDMFAAACGGAIVSNMFSAYGGIRWGSGLVRQMQYESGQSRIGGSIWEMPLRYLENSPIFFADKITTPLLLMHNDRDGAVPWYQGIEMFAAMRRLNKPVWMVNYNGEDHNLTARHNRKDWSIRMQQFFDHYLKDAPMPVWMATGIPATEKGRTLGLDPYEPPPSDRKDQPSMYDEKVSVTIQGGVQ